MGILMFAAVGVLGSVELSRASARPVEPPGKEATAPRTMDVIVKDGPSGRPIAGATIRASIGMEYSIRKTDRDGRARVILFRHKSRENLNLDVWADGYVQQRHFFSQKDARSPKIPATFTVELLPGEQTLGGTVHDEQGRPIQGVRVAIWGYLGEKKRKEELAFMVDATTDEQGRWRCRCFRDMTFANLYLSHPDYVADNSYHPRRHGSPDPTTPPRPGDQPLQALRDFTDVQVMTRGVEVSGEVRDEAGKPVEGAEVGWLESSRNKTFHDDIATTTTDAGGRFRFGHVRPGNLAVQVKASGHAPELKRVEAKPGAEPVTVGLGPPHRLEGRVVDTKRRPIPGAFVSIDTWRDFRTLGVLIETDADGRFRWKDAPADPVLINAMPAGFDPVFQRRVTAGEDITLILRRALSISGRIRDAATGKDVDPVEVEVGYTDPDTGKFFWEKSRGVFGAQGRLHARVDVERLPEFRLRVRAKGYEPSETRTFHADEGQVKYDVSLKKTGGPPGGGL